MGRIRIGFIGAGTMGQCAHLQHYASLPECEVIALAELRPALGRAVALRYGIPKLYSSHEEILEDADVEAFVAPQPFQRHGQLIPELYKRDIPLMTEKPLAAWPLVGTYLLDSLAKRSARHYVAYHKRSDPATVYAVREIRRLQQTDELGRLSYVRILMPAGDWVASGMNTVIKTDEPVPPLEMDAPPVDIDEDGRREFIAFVNYYTHQLNLMRFLLGEDYSISYADPMKVMLVVHSTSGVPGVIEMSPYVTTVDWQEEALVCFEQGYVRLRLPAPLAANRPGQVTLFRDAGQGKAPAEIHPQMPWVSAMRQQAMYFVAAVRGEHTPLCEAAEAQKDLEAARSYLRFLRGR
jgi:predicted dehydrogenase